MSIRLSLRRLKLPVGLLTVGVVAGLSLPATAVAASRAAQANSQTPLPVRNGSATDVGPYNPAQTIRLAIGLKAPHKAAEQQFLNAIQDKHSRLFHHYLTVAQWTARFGPSAAAQNAVVSWARGAGLTVTHLYPNRLIVDLAGQVGAIEKALGVQINNYRLGTKTFFANNHDRCCRHH
jgi:kumamolisin